MDQPTDPAGPRPAEPAGTESAGTTPAAEPAGTTPAAEPAGTELQSKLAANVVRFARVLRRAGVPIGPGRILDALRALERVDTRRREQFYWALHTVLVSDHRQHQLFDDAFRLFFRPAVGMDDILATLLSTARVPMPRQPSQPPGRVADAFSPRTASPPPPRTEPDSERELDAAMTFSDLELLRHRDFAEMSADELCRARALIARIRMPLPTVTTRRFRPDPRGARVDMRATMRAAVRAGAGSIPLCRRAPRRRPPPLVILCDISGSMERYSQMLLYLMHGLVQDRARVHTFVFGTRLTNVTRYLRQRDIDRALAQVGRAVVDWSGGTRIGPCLGEFNLCWSRRVLGQGAVILLVTDGLDREDGAGLGPIMERMRKSCRRLVWLNPLLGYDRFEPRAHGIRAMLPHVDEFRPVHNLASLEDLARALDTAPAARPPRRSRR